MSGTTFLSLLAIAQLALGRSVQVAQVDVNDTVARAVGSNSVPRSLLETRDADPADFRWARRWAAVGDSYTAGIGSGRQLGDFWHKRDDWYCSRYDLSYPYLVNGALGAAVEDFQFPACSGDRSEQIYDQIQKIDGTLDLVMMTAGGNDLCLASLLKTCIFLPFNGESKCQNIIDVAKKNIDTILKPNIRQLLSALNDKMNKKSVVVYNGYAQFFNTENDACEKDQNWLLAGRWFSRGLTLNKDRRTKFNELVTGINDAIRDVVEEFRKKDLNYKIDMADWDLWPQKGVKGQFCDPSSSGHYPDDSQKDLQFFKQDTYVAPLIHDELRKRDPAALQKEEEEFQAFVAGLNKDSIYDSLLYKSANKRAEVLHKLDPRAPAPPSCPGDGDFDVTLGLGLPDTFGKLFHPNELGHKSIASFAMSTAMDIRAEILGVSAPACQKTDNFDCYQKQGRKAYAGVDRMNENYKDFCDSVKVPENEQGWHFTKKYHEGTPDEHDMTVSLGNAKDFNKDETDGTCEGWYKVFFGTYTVEGAGWATWDYGQDTLLKSLRGCMGSGITKWKFDYYDSPSDSGMEWKATFHTPIWVRARCMKNDKVQRASGGHTDGCKGND
ncbi:hypothetical protein LLEC1_05530 [Akanthomyces lecanii]|uniref:SGNH hydrolase-type esterase domain-containing protein n=1 Tax=Cordyceps confragosa TaxID=2714763 RepID=A0A179IJT3_CORDF|nr:hypothetical protein LLEC1_05530 [Akanthomyces lecanii]